MASRRPHPPTSGMTARPSPSASALPPVSESTRPDQRQAQFELGVALALALWPALTLAVQQQWGGPQSADKRDWFAGAVIDLFGGALPAAVSTAVHVPAPVDVDVEVEDVETLLLQVMLDEFEVNVDDESAWETATRICRLWMDCAKGDFGEVQRLKERWENRGRGRAAEQVRFQRVEDEDEEDTDGDSDSSEDDDVDEDEDGDVEMGGASPPRARAREKTLPEVDEDGFTKVTGKKKR